MSHKLKEGAIFIADAHYPNHSKELITLLESINSSKLQTPQLFLMGDIFDLLVGNSPYLKERFSKDIELIEQIATKIEVFYIEGNHDFNLKPLFKNTKIIPISKQPLILKDQNKTIAISHGDKFNTTLLYKIYTKFIRNPFIIKLIPQIYAKKKIEKMSKKNICKKIKNFENTILNIKKYYSSNLIIEGHFHQGIKSKNYISLPSFACDKMYGVYKKFDIEFISY